MFKIISTIALIFIGNYWLNMDFTPSVQTKTEVSLPQNIGLKKSEEQGFDLLKNQSRFVLQANYILGGTYQSSVAFEKGNLIILSNGNIKEGSFTLAMNSIKNASCQSNEMSKEVEKYLTSEEYLAVQKFSKAEFSIQKVTPIIDVFDFKNMMIEGLFTIKGISKTVSFMATTTQSNHSIKLEGNFILDFKKWNTCSSKLDEKGNGLITNEIKVNLNLVFSPGC